MGGVVSLIPGIALAVKAIADFFKKPAAQPCPIDNSVLEHLAAQRNPPQQTGPTAEEMQAQKEELAQREREIQQKQAESNQRNEKARLEMEKLKIDIDQKALNIDQAKADLQAKAQEISKRDEKSKVEKAKIKAQREERHKPRDEGTLKWLRQFAIEKLGLDCVSDYNVGIAGPSGVGKSTTINGLRQLLSDDPRAARVDENECTAVMTKYPHPTQTHLILWDCPGAGTQKNPLATYFYDKFLFAFDYLLFVFTERFREAEIDLMKQAIAHRVPFACVRNKTNHDFDNRRRRDRDFRALPQREAVAKLIAEHHKIIERNLKEAGINSFLPEIFVINAFALVDEGEVGFEEARMIEHVSRAIYKRRNP